MLRLITWVCAGVLIAGMFAALYRGTEHTSACYTPCDCTTPVDRPCP